MHHFNKKKGKLAYMALKIDMAKAYDRVEWNVLRKILHLHGFSPEFFNLIDKCITSPSYSILLNGSPFGHFAATRGLTQGDPLSPFPCTIYYFL